MDLMVSEIEDVDCGINDHCIIILRCNDSECSGLETELAFGEVTFSAYVNG